MTTTGVNRIFVDTNVLVFASRRSSQRFGSAQAALHELNQHDHEVWISRQILREYLVQLTRPGAFPQGTSETAASQVRQLASQYRIADETETVTVHLLELLRTVGAAGKQIHDANIVATMLAYRVPRLLTDNVKDFKRYSSLITIIPLEREA